MKDDDEDRAARRLQGAWRLRRLRESALFCVGTRHWYESYRRRTVCPDDGLPSHHIDAAYARLARGFGGWERLDAVQLGAWA